MQESAPAQVRSLRLLLPPLVMTAAVLLLHLKPLLFGVSFHDPGAFHHDYSIGCPTTHHLIHEFHQTGRPPLWVASQVMGCPYLGHYLPSVAHPLTLIFFQHDLARAMALIVTANALITALFAYALFLRCRASEWASAAAGFLTVMTGFVLWVSLIYPVAYPIPWMLCWLWAMMGLAEKPLLKRWLWVAFASFMIVLGGDAQLTVQGAYLLGAWWLIWVWRARIPLPRVARVIALLIAAAAAAWLLVSVQMLPAILFFSHAVTTRTPSLFDYASTFPPALHSVAAGFGLFSRLFINLFIPVMAALLFLAALKHRLANPALQASLVIAVILGVLALGGRSGLAAIPFHLPMLEMFIRHYKFGVLLQGPLMIGLALGFDALLPLLREKKKIWRALFLFCLALTMLVLPDHAWRAAVALAALVFWRLAVTERAGKGAAAALFALLAIDAGSQSWSTPFSLSLPRHDPEYHRFVDRLEFHGRVQGMYPWTALLTPKVNPHLPVHGHGLNGEFSLDSWLEFPLKNHAYFLAAICPQVADIEDGVFSRVDFATCFKSTDFVNDQNRHLVDLAGLRYFFLQDMALSAADRFPLLSDPAYSANPARPDPFAPWKKSWRGPESAPTYLAKNRPALAAVSFGAFNYEREFTPRDSFSATAAWSPGPAGLTKSDLAVSALIFEDQDRKSLLFFRVFNPGESGACPVEKELAASSAGPGRLSFALFPFAGKQAQGQDNRELGGSFFWGDPQIISPDQTIKYRAGDLVMVFENEQARGRARIARKAVTASSNQQALELMRDPERYAPGTMTILMPPWAPLIHGSTVGPEETAELLAYQNDQAVVRARLDSPGYLILSDTYYPGWRAFDREGRELRIHRADLTMRAVVLDSGEHTITFRYLPADFAIGLFATLTALAGFFLLPPLFRRPA